MNNKQATIAALIGLGYPEIKGKCSKYRVFQRTDGKLYYVGNAGALRVGTTIAGSMCLTGGPRHKVMIELGNLLSIITEYVSPAQAREFYDLIAAKHRQAKAIAS